ncbi:glutamine synthetase, partial [[Clostridium] innocuum]|nr:glutamine synthetase [[Clostridium] innocuum]
AAWVDKAPKYICYSRSNRSALIRIPAADEHRTRIEVRSPDPSCNPYLALALLIAAGMEGIDKGAKAEEAHGNIYVQHEGLLELPNSLQEALQLAQNSSFAKRVLKDELLQGYLNAKKKQLRI